MHILPSLPSLKLNPPQFASDGGAPLATCGCYASPALGPALPRSPDTVFTRPSHISSLRNCQIKPPRPLKTTLHIRTNWPPTVGPTLPRGPDMVFTRPLSLAPGPFLHFISEPPDKTVAASRSYPEIATSHSYWRLACPNPATSANWWWLECRKAHQDCPAPA